METISIQTDDGKEFEVPVGELSEFRTILAMQEDTEPGESIPIMIDSEILNKIIALIKEYNSIKQREGVIDLKKEEEIQSLMYNLFNTEQISEVYKLLEGLEFMGLDPDSSFKKDLYGFYVDYLLNVLSCSELEKKILTDGNQGAGHALGTCVGGPEGSEAKASEMCVQTVPVVSSAGMLPTPPAQGTVVSLATTDDSVIAPSVKASEVRVLQGSPSERFVTVSEENKILSDNPWIKNFFHEYLPKSSYLAALNHGPKQREIDKQVVYE